jgi:hypothetical protein
VELARAHGVDAHIGDAATFNEGAPYDAIFLADVVADVLSPERLIANAVNTLAGMKLAEPRIKAKFRPTLRCC